ncbi:MAG: hypothetical protein R2795_25110 [Saprospiraceae bacterium]
MSRIPEVISVGAVDDNKKLLSKSSIAEKGEIGPTCVSNGNTNLPEQLIDTSPLYKRPKPATSYAAPKVSRSICSIFLMIDILGTLIKYSTNHSITNEELRKVHLTRIGLPDSTNDLDIEQYPKLVREMYNKKDFTFHVVPTLEELNWIDELKYGLDKIGHTRFYLANWPADIIFLIKEIALKLKGYSMNEVGYGYIDIDIVCKYFSKYTFVKFLKLILKKNFDKVFHGPHRQFIMKHDTKMRYLWSEEKARAYCLLAYNSVMYPYKITY